jgi:hypothetical protein
MKQRTLLVTAALVASLIATPLAAAAAGNGSSGWHLGYYNSSGRALSMSQTSPGSGVASFNFTNQDNTALLIDTQGSSPFVGNDLGKTITAVISVSDVTGSFSSYGTCGSTPPTVRLFFETSYSAGGFAYTDYWWSHDATYVLANGTAKITALVEPSSATWSDWNGQASSDPTYSSAFSAAASDVTGIGFSFGGGCFFENGVGTADGSGTFALTSFSVS